MQCKGTRANLRGADLTKLRRSTDPRIRAAVWDVDTAQDDNSRVIRLHLLSLIVEGRA